MSGWMFNTSLSYHVMQQLFHIWFHLLCILPCISLLNKSPESWCPAAVCTEHDDLPEAVHCPSRSHHAHSCVPIGCTGQPIGNLEHASPQWRTSLAQVVLYSIAPKDNLHYTSVFPLTFLPDVSLHNHQQLWLPLMIRTMLVKATVLLEPCTGWHQNPSGTLPLYVISSNHGLTGHVSYWIWWASLQLYA